MAISQLTSAAIVRAADPRYGHRCTARGPHSVAKLYHMVKLPYLFPLHLRPLVAKTLEAASASDRGSRQQEIFAALAEALLHKTYVKLHYPIGDPASSIQEPIVLPEVLFPYLNSWHLIGICRQRNRIMSEQ